MKDLYSNTYSKKSVYIFTSVDIVKLLARDHEG